MVVSGKASTYWPAAPPGGRKSLLDGLADGLASCCAFDLMARRNSLVSV
jgi:hypothetical protein